MNNSKNILSVVVIAVVVTFAIVGLWASTYQGENIKLSPTQFSATHQTSDMEMTCADMTCNSPSDFDSEQPSTFEIIQQSIQNSMNNATKWFEDTRNDINRHIKHKNYDNYVAYSNR